MEQLLLQLLRSFLWHRCATVMSLQQQSLSQDWPHIPPIVWTALILLTTSLGSVLPGTMTRLMRKGICEHCFMADELLPHAGFLSANIDDCIGRENLQI